MKYLGRAWWPLLAFASALLGLPALGRSPHGANLSSRRIQPPDHRISIERTGAIPAAGGHSLRLTADSGSVHIFTDSSTSSGANEVRYRVRVEAAAADPDAGLLLKQFAVTGRRTPDGVELTGRMPNRDDVERVWVSYEVHVPRSYDLNVSTGAGDIETQDMDGHVVLSTGGGTIRAGRVGGSHAGAAPSGAEAFWARLQTGGGHIFVGDVAGGLHAVTAGGHIVAGNVKGDAVLQTDGGHIQVGRVSGTAQLSTGGGNIVAEGADGGVQADSAGGRIELGEASGAIRARTSGGGIRIARLAGPTNLDASDGGIFLAGVAAPVRAATGSGTITAWFSPGPDGISNSAAGPVAKRAARGGAASRSELISRTGNIVVYLPREMPVTIDALIEQSSGHRIVADPSLPVQVKYEDAASGHSERGECVLNGGGEVLRLRADAGDIELRVLDPQTARRLAEQQMEEVVSRLDAQRAILSGVQGNDAVGRGEAEGVGAANPAGDVAVLPLNAFSLWTRWFDQMWWGGVRVASEEQQRRLVRSAAPVYPDAAQQAGIEGEVTLRIVVGPDGIVKDVRPMAGDPVLLRAAADAVEQWRYAPALLDGQPVGVVTTVTLAFRLR